jgi:glucosamine--fructose-6-phosphate aminotransferase (isomerizing)
MSTDGHTWQEILSQSQIWQSTLDGFAADRPALEAFLDRADFDQVAVVGCGSTHYLAQCAASTFTHWTGRPARAFPSSEVWLFPDTIPRGRWLLLTVSRSGTTTETLRALERFRETVGGPVLAITCYPESPLAQQADFTLAAPHAQEQSIAQTRSFTSMLLLTQALTAAIVRDEAMLERQRQLPGLLDDLMGRLGDLPRRLGADLTIDRIFFLGAGPLYGLASEATLKTKEMSLSYSEAYHPLEFRHGPMSMVNERTLVVGLLSDTGQTEELRVLRDMRELGARTLALVEDGSTLAEWRPDHVVELRSGLSEWERLAQYLPPLQLLAYHRAAGKGLDPDNPRHLEAVVFLDQANFMAQSSGGRAGA